MDSEVSRYRAEITPSRTHPGVLEYTITRYADPAATLPPELAGLIEGLVLEPVADLTTPMCDRSAARSIVEAWMTVECVGSYDIEYVWHEEPVEPRQESCGAGGRYAEHGRRS